MNSNSENNDYNYEEALWSSEKRYRVQRKVETILKMYMLVGSLMAIFGVAYFALLTLNVELSSSQINALLISGVGFTVTIMSWGMLIIRKEKLFYEKKRGESMEAVSDFLRYWAKFETIGKYALEKEHKSYNKYSIREMIEILYEEGKIDKSDLLALEEAIQLRNSIVHKGDELPSEKSKKYIEFLAQVIKKIKPI